MAGGHTVPIEKILTRYVKSMANLSAVFRLADRVYVFDNSVDGAEAQLCVRTEAGALRKVYGPLPSWVNVALQGLPPHPQLIDLRHG